jgi:fructose-1,6-bisphosphatase-3
LLHERTEDTNKTAYVNVIVDTIIATGRADDFIIAISNVIQRLAIDQLHMLGDIYDRGPGAHKIMDLLDTYHHWDITWGNHDMMWMGAAAGNKACVCSVIRLSLRYANLITLEEGYGINLVPLATFAMDVYGGDPCTEFMPKLMGGSDQLDEKTQRLTAQMHKAIAVIQFKIEAQLYDKQSRMAHARPQGARHGRLQEGYHQYQRTTTTSSPAATSPPSTPSIPTCSHTEEAELIDKLQHSFAVSEKLHQHMRVMLAHGSMYGIYNNNLLFHASVPLNADGSLKEVEVMPGQYYSGIELMRQIGILIRTAFQADASEEAKTMPETTSSTSGAAPTVRCSTNRPWRPSSAISSRKKRHTRKRRATTSSCAMMRRCARASWMPLVSRERTATSSTAMCRCAWAKAKTPSRPMAGLW